MSPALRERAFENVAELLAFPAKCTFSQPRQVHQDTFSQFFVAPNTKFNGLWSETTIHKPISDVLKQMATKFKVFKDGDPRRRMFFPTPADQLGYEQTSAGKAAEFAFVHHQLIKGVGPFIAARDFVCLGCFKIVSENEIVIAIGNLDVEERLENVVRATLLNQHFVIKQDAPNGKVQTKVSLFALVDPAGAIPAALFNQVVEEKAKIMVDLKREIEAKKFPISPKKSKEPNALPTPPPASAELPAAPEPPAVVEQPRELVVASPSAQAAQPAKAAPKKPRGVARACCTRPEYE